MRPKRRPTRNPSDRHMLKAWRAVLMGDPCVYCGAVAEGLDHLVAAASGGSNGWKNRAPACARCDRLKGDASLLGYLWSCEQARRMIARREAWRRRRGLGPMAESQRRVSWQDRVAGLSRQFKSRGHTMPKRPPRPTNVIGNAVYVMKVATGEIDVKK